VTRIGLLQLNPTVGDLPGNAARIAAGVRSAGAKGADLVVTSELALLGYLPRDLLLNRAFIDRSWEVAERLAKDLAQALPHWSGWPSRMTRRRGGRSSTPPC